MNMFGVEKYTINIMQLPLDECMQTPLETG
jgi:hypothetical protein